MAQIKEFPTVEELSNGFSEFKLAQVSTLIGEELVLYYEDGECVTYHFVDHECIKVRYKNNDEEVMYACLYSAVSPRDNMYIIDFIQGHGKPQSITTVIDLNRHIATTMCGVLPSEEEACVSQLERAQRGMPMTSVRTTFSHASVGKAFDETTAKHMFTSELIGKRVQFRYSSNDVYEHIYLNDSFYTWHCIEGIEAGLCDTDRCYYLKLADDLYWFTWLEKVVPTIGTVIEDLAPDKMRSYGKLCGYDNYGTGNITNFQVGSYATILD